MPDRDVQSTVIVRRSGVEQGPRGGVSLRNLAEEPDPDRGGEGGTVVDERSIDRARPGIAAESRDGRPEGRLP